ncbi:hypothetical protein MUK42_08056 [Musa troglodytarum]|uniref:Uncharacterized protein n=1 Tax=Musa troglodytarum TaxID=320322 RepID=A0A9E7KN46_9LILI|nr:hypothetical protein MUK42_08056 [Musa troglodytarum]
MVVYAAAAAAAGHPDEWVHDAFSDPRLAATVLLSFRRGSRPEPESEGDEKPSTSSAAADAPLPEWGRRIKRPRMMRLPRILSATRDEEMEDEAAEKRKGKRRASPQSPLEGYSSASASDGEERASSAEKPPKAPMSPFPASPSGDGRTKMTPGDRVRAAGVNDAALSLIIKTSLIHFGWLCLLRVATWTLYLTLFSRSIFFSPRWSRTCVRRRSRLSRFRRPSDGQHRGK